jgi:hypothetical protein
MPSLRDRAHKGVLCTFGNRSATDRGQVVWSNETVSLLWSVSAGGMDRPYHVQNHTLLGHSSPPIQAGRRAGPAF